MLSRFGQSRKSGAPEKSARSYRSARQPGDADKFRCPIPELAGEADLRGIAAGNGHLPSVDEKGSTGVEICRSKKAFPKAAVVIDRPVSPKPCRDCVLISSEPMPETRRPHVFVRPPVAPCAGWRRARSAQSLMPGRGHDSIGGSSETSAGRPSGPPRPVCRGRPAWPKGWSRGYSGYPRAGSRPACRPRAGA